MPDNTNAQAIAFTNQKARITADLIGTLYQTMLRFQTEWVAENAATNIPNDTNFIADGSSPNQVADNGQTPDGRKPVTDAQINNLKALVDALVTFFQGSVTIGGVTNTRIFFVQQVTTNEQAKF